MRFLQRLNLKALKVPDRLDDRLRDECDRLWEDSASFEVPFDLLDLCSFDEALSVLLFDPSSSRDFLLLRCDEALRRSRSSFSRNRSRSRCSRSRRSRSRSDRSRERDERLEREDVWVLRSFERRLELLDFDSDLDRRGFFGDGTVSEFTESSPSDSLAIKVLQSWIEWTYFFN